MGLMFLIVLDDMLKGKFFTIYKDFDSLRVIRDEKRKEEETNIFSQILYSMVKVMKSFNGIYC